MLWKNQQSFCEFTHCIRKMYSKCHQFQQHSSATEKCSLKMYIVYVSFFIAFIRCETYVISFYNNYLQHINVVLLSTLYLCFYALHFECLKRMLSGFITFVSDIQMLWKN
jgi:hypothetical protein